MTQNSPPIPAYKDKAFSFLQEACKQLLTLSTAVLGVTVTFFKEFTEAPDGNVRGLIQWSWVLFVMSIVAGLICMFCLTGQLAGEAPDIKAKNILITAGAQQLLFAAALVLAVLAGVDAIGAVPEGGPAGASSLSTAVI